MDQRNIQTIAKNHLKAPKSFDKWCKSEFPVYMWSNKTQTIVSSDRKSEFVIKKRLTKKSNLNFFATAKCFVIVLVSKKRIEIQTYEYTQTINDGVEKICSRLYNLEVFTNNHHYKLSKPNSNAEWQRGLLTRHGLGGPYSNVYLYACNDWKSKLSINNDMKYLDIFKLDMGIFDISHVYKYRERIEYCQKIHAEKLADQIVGQSTYWYGYGYHVSRLDMRRITMNFLRRNKSFFKNTNRQYSDLELRAYFEERGGKMVDGIENYIRLSDIQDIPKNIGVIKFQNWVIKQKVEMKDYRDYIKLLTDIGVEISGKSILLPSNFQSAHDKATEIYNKLQQEKKAREARQQQEMYMERLDTLMKLEAQIDNFKFVIPKELEELIQEGYKLNHCVGTYIDRVASGETTIIFVRSVEHPQDSLYTLEVSTNGELIQLRGRYNQKAEEQAQKATEHFIEQAKARHLFAA